MLTRFYARGGVAIWHTRPFPVGWRAGGPFELTE